MTDKTTMTVAIPGLVNGKSAAIKIIANTAEALCPHLPQGTEIGIDYVAPGIGMKHVSTKCEANVQSR